MSLYTRKDRIHGQQVFEGRIFKVHVDRVQRADTGRELNCEVVEHNGGVVIACKPSTNEVLLIKQYRYPVDEVLIELPAGRVELGEDRFEAAKRELIEETGFRASKWQELPPMFSAPGFCTELLTCYLAEELEFVGKNLDEDEETDVMRVTLDEAWQLVTERQIRDAKTIAILGYICRP